ncbi:phosphoserine transaminase [Sesbania bispinosa]|nr:phosphoserine transaminase [Sesbania bispinosa]
MAPKCKSSKEHVHLSPRPKMHEHDTKDSKQHNTHKHKHPKVIRKNTTIRDGKADKHAPPMGGGLTLGSGMGFLVHPVLWRARRVAG